MVRNELKKYSRAAGDLSQVKNVDAIGNAAKKTLGKDVVPQKPRCNGLEGAPKILT
jgi:hypothetical protein